ncbi:MAG: hypothetical protein ACP5L4_01895 [Thermoplasmata archaeon]
MEYIGEGTKLSDNYFIISYEDARRNIIKNSLIWIGLFLGFIFLFDLLQIIIFILNIFYNPTKILQEIPPIIVLNGVFLFFIFIIYNYSFKKYRNEDEHLKDLLIKELKECLKKEKDSKKGATAND